MRNAGEKAIFLHCLPAFHDLKTKIGKEQGEKYGFTDLEVTDEVYAPFQLPNYSNTFSGVCLVNFFNLWYNTKKEWRRTMKHTALITGCTYLR